MNYWKEKGADPRKLVMGIPMYGQAFTLANPNENGLNAKAPQRGLQGEFTRAAGFLAYYEVTLLGGLRISNMMKPSLCRSAKRSSPVGQWSITTARPWARTPSRETSGSATTT